MNDPKHSFYAEILCGCIVIDTAMKKIGDFIVYFLPVFEAIFKKTLTRVSGAQGKLYDEKNQR
jgi:hypothetical protein